MPKSAASLRSADEPLPTRIFQERLLLADCHCHRVLRAVQPQHIFWVGMPPVSKWGVGLARKTGMDEAVRRFNSINRPDGVILNIDADCTVDSNYFIEICDKF